MDQLEHFQLCMKIVNKSIYFNDIIADYGLIVVDITVL